MTKRQRIGLVGPDGSISESLRAAPESAGVPAGEINETAAGLTFKISRLGIIETVDFVGSSLFGYSYEELNSGTFPLSNLIPPEDIEGTNRTLNELRSLSSGFRFRHRVLTRDSEIRWILTSGRFLYSAVGKYTGTEGVLVEITDLVNQEAALAEAEARYRSLIAVLEVGVIVLSDRILLANSQAEQILELDRHSSSDTPTDQLQDLIRHISSEMDGAPNPSTPFTYTRSDGTIRLLIGSVESVKFKGKEVRQVAVRDITDERRAEELRMAQAEILEAIATGKSTKSILDAICTSYERFNPETLCTIVLVEGGLLNPISAPSLPPEFSASLKGLQIGPTAGSCGKAAYTGVSAISVDIDSDPIWDQYRHLSEPYDLRSCWSTPVISANKIAATFAIYKRVTGGPSEQEWHSALQFNRLTAVTIEHGRAIEALRFDATHDPLTESPNRSEFRRELQEILSDLNPTQKVAVASVDIDNFRLINETWGHPTGDKVLRTIAARLNTVEGGEIAGSVARVSGDEFLISRLIESTDGIDSLARDIRRAIALPILTARNDFRLDARIGIATSDLSFQDAEELMRNADSALHASKANRKTTYNLYTSVLRERSSRQLQIINELRTALESDSLGIALQPEVNLNTGRVLGFEILARWHHPELGPISPSEFIPIAEQSGLIIQLGRQIMLRTFRIQSEWAKDLRRNGTLLALNVSSQQLVSQDFVAVVKQMAAELDVDTSLVCFEITESAVMEDPEGALAAIAQLTELGFRFAIDDFGTGYSSLSQLSQIPTDFIKLDQTFVSRLGQSKEAMAITEAVIGIADALDRIVIAEGVETEKQREILGSLGIEFGQGFLFYRPLTKESARGLLQSGGF